MTTAADRALLLRLAQGPVSGDVLAREAGQTRAAVWKRIRRLREAGLVINAWPGIGYALASPLDLLEPDRIRQALPASVAAGIDALDVAWSLESTNSELLRGGARGPGAQVLLAERQSGGRGRRGRGWASPLAANLYLSVARGFEGGLARLGGLSLVAGVAVAEGLRTLGAAGVGLKWPNDIVVADAGGLRKLGGILVEGGGEHAGPARAVIGIGLNVGMPAAAAARVDQPWADLRALLDPAPSRNALAAVVIAALLPALACFDREGLAPFLARYAACDVLAGTQVRIHAGDGVHEGIALGPAADGALRLQTRGGERVFHAGEVSLRRLETQA